MLQNCETFVNLFTKITPFNTSFGSFMPEGMKVLPIFSNNTSRYLLSLDSEREVG
jgi:hypothetical protein